MHESLRDRLFSLQDTAYRDFHSRLIPNIDPASSKPPLPENKDPIVISCFICPTPSFFPHQWQCVWFREVLFPQAGQQ